MKEFLIDCLRSFINALVLYAIMVCCVFPLQHLKCWGIAIILSFFFLDEIRELRKEKINVFQIFTAEPKKEETK